MSTRITQYGFEFGPITVTRLASQPQWGAVVEVEGKRQRIEIRVTPTGLLRVGKVITKEKTKP